jgi:hypothetical protein
VTNTLERTCLCHWLWILDTVPPVFCWTRFPTDEHTEHLAHLLATGGAPLLALEVTDNPLLHANDRMEGLEFRYLLRDPDRTDLNTKRCLLISFIVLLPFVAIFMKVFRLSSSDFRLGVILLLLKEQQYIVILYLRNMYYPHTWFHCLQWCWILSHHCQFDDWSLSL